MADNKETSKKATDSQAESTQTSTEETATQTSEPMDEEQTEPLTTGLEDYGRWRSFYQNYQRPKNEKPFRRGRIWC